MSDDFGMLDIGGEISGRPLNVFFILDVSGSMEGTRIGALNAALDKSLKQIEGIQQSALHLKIKISVLSFSSKVKWMYPSPIDVDKFVYNPLQAEDMTYLYLALEELEEKLHKTSTGGWMEDSKTSYLPVFILISDGQPNGQDYHPALESLFKNGYFATGARAAIALDDSTIRSVLEEFTGNSETVLEANGAKAIEAMILDCCARSVAVSSSMGVGSSVKTEDATTLLGESMAAAKQEEEEAKATAVNLKTDSPTGWLGATPDGVVFS